MDIATIKELGVDLVTRALTLIHDWMLMDEYVQVNGLVVLVDYTGASLEMFRVWFHPDKSRDKVAYIQVRVDNVQGNSTTISLDDLIRYTNW